MRKSSTRIRSGPLYIQAGSEVISLVAEAGMGPANYDISHEIKSVVTQPVGIYVIDKQGVRRIAVRADRSISLLTLFLGAVLMPLHYVFFRWWNRHRI